MGIFLQNVKERDLGREWCEILGPYDYMSQARHTFSKKFAEI